MRLNTGLVLRMSRKMRLNKGSVLRMSRKMRLNTGSVLRMSRKMRLNTGSVLRMSRKMRLNTGSVLRMRPGNPRFYVIVARIKIPPVHILSSIFWVPSKDQTSEFLIWRHGTRNNYKIYLQFSLCKYPYMTRRRKIN